MRIAIVFCFLTLAIVPAHADWRNLEQTASGTMLRVRLRSGELLKGRMQSVTAERLSLAVKDGGTRETSRDSITRVTRKSRTKGALWGAMIGFGCAAPFGAFAGPYIADWGNPSTDVRLRHAAGWGMFGAGIGAGIGALTGKSATIYRN